MGKNERQAYLKAIRSRYQRAGKKAKVTILDEFCAVCGYHRKYDRHNRLFFFYHYQVQFSSYYLHRIFATKLYSAVTAGTKMIWTWG